MATGYIPEILIKLKTTDYKSPNTKVQDEEQKHYKHEGEKTGRTTGWQVKARTHNSNTPEDCR